MQIDVQNIYLIKSYKRKELHPRSKEGASPSGLEIFIRRTSTPSPDILTYRDNSPVFDKYEMFRTVLEIPPKKVSVRGMAKPPYDFISGLLIPFEKNQKNEKFDYTSIALNVTGEKPKKVTFKDRYLAFKKTVKSFFTKYYRNFIRNKCDYSICPVTCKCQRVKSFLNKTIVMDEEETTTNTRNTTI